ncbi:MAG: polysaccharide biosynthesis/export family protein [Planctomycetota bacterium]
MPLPNANDPDRPRVAARRRPALAERFAAGLLLAAAAASLSGCAAFTNPVANGIPVRLVPEELLAESREVYEPVDLALLRRPPLEKYVLEAGDTLGIYVEGIIGDASTPPPVNLPSTPEEPPAIGFPFPVRAEGSISLPLVEPVKVAGLTIEEAERAVKDAYLERQILRSDETNPRIIVTLLRSRTIRVLVVREDGSTPSITVRSASLRGFGAGSTTVGGGSESSGNQLELPIGQNDLLTALTSTGGLPGPGAKQEVVIYRGYASGDAVAGCYVCGPAGSAGGVGPGGEAGRRVIRVPLRQRCGTRVSVPQDDVVLQDGDIITVEAREPELYYTGGLLPPAELALPLEYDLSVIEAVLRAQGPMVSGGINGNNLQGNITGVGIGNPSPSQVSVLRKLPNGQQVNILVELNEALRDPRLDILVQAGDILILQENRDEAISRYLNSSVFQGNLFFRWLDRGDATGTGSIVLP